MDNCLLVITCAAVLSVTGIADGRFFALLSDDFVLVYLVFRHKNELVRSNWKRGEMPEPDGFRMKPRIREMFGLYQLNKGESK